MVKRNSPYAYCEKCIIDMDSMDSQGGIISCDTAEDLNFDRVEILKQCEYAEKYRTHEV